MNIVDFNGREFIGFEINFQHTNEYEFMQLVLE